MDRAVELMERVGIPRAAERLRSYPHEFSGGMRQRVMIAMALSCSPQPADRRRADDGARRDDPGPDPRGAARSCATRPSAGIILVTHDLGVVADIADRIDRHVRRAGWSSRARSTSSSTTPSIPYTWGLLGSITRIDGDRRRAPAGDPGPAAVAAATRPRAATSARAARTRSTGAPRSRRSRRAPARDARRTATAAGWSRSDKRRLRQVGTGIGLGRRGDARDRVSRPAPAPATAPASRRRCSRSSTSRCYFPIKRGRRSSTGRSGTSTPSTTSRSTSPRARRSASSASRAAARRR